MKDAGRQDEARAELRARPDDAPTVVSEAWLLAALGETEAAFDVLARAEDERQAFLYYAGFPGFDPLRGDPRASEHCCSAWACRPEMSPPGPVPCVGARPLRGGHLGGLSEGLAPDWSGLRSSK